MKKYILPALLTATIAVTGYYTHRLWVFAGKVTKNLDYTYAAINCLIMENGQVESDVEILYKGYHSRKAYFQEQNRKTPGLYEKKTWEYKVYDDHIPECHNFYARYRCWELDPHDPLSLDGCGKHFGLTQEEIDLMKKDPATINRVMDASFERMKKKNGG